MNDLDELPYRIVKDSSYYHMMDLIWNNDFVHSHRMLTHDERFAVGTLAKNMNFSNVVKLGGELKEKVAPYLQSLIDKGYISEVDGGMQVNKKLVLPWSDHKHLDILMYWYNEVSLP